MLIYIYAGLLEYAKSKGVPVYPDTSFKTFTSFPNLIFSGREICGNCSKALSSYHNSITVEEFYEYCNNYSAVLGIQTPIKLTRDYNAQFEKEGVVTVGCQQIPYEAIKQVYNRIIEIEKLNR